MSFKGKVLKPKSHRQRFFADGLDPVVNVPVTDGLNTVLTDENGSFELPGWERAHVISVGMLTMGHNDWFLPVDGREEYNFCVRPAEVGENFSFLHMSDTEIFDDIKSTYFPFVYETTRKLKPDFFIHTGDICREFAMERHYYAMNSEVLGCPVRWAIGNHDYCAGDYGEQLFEKLYGPTWYSFECGEVHFVSLSFGRGDTPSGYKYTDQWQWLANDLSLVTSDKKLIVMCHDIFRRNEFGFKAKIEDIDLDLIKHNIIAWLFGHFHHNYAHEKDGILNICSSRPHSGGIDSSAGAIRECIYEDGKLTTTMHYYMPAPETPDEHVWCTKLDGRVKFSTPILDNKKIFVATIDDGFPKKCGIYALSEESGEIIWSYPTKDSIKGNIAYDEGRLFAQDTMGVIYCLDANNGTLIWKVTTPLAYPTYTCMPVTLEGDLVLGGCGTLISAYDKTNGELVWRSEELSDSSASGPAAIVYDKYRNSFIASPQWKFVVSIDADTGKVNWKNPAQPVWFRTSTPLVTEEAIYTNGGSSVAKMDPLTGEFIITKPAGATMDTVGAPVLDSNTLYYTTASRGVLAFDKDTMEKVCEFGTRNTRLYTAPYYLGDGQMVESSAIIRGDELIFTACDGYIYFYDKNTAEKKREIFIGAPSLVDPIITDDAIITADFEGNVIKFKL